jgi:hypothetical protein
MLKFETRTCTCGTEFDALDFWSDDATCDTCSMRRYDERLAAINKDRAYVVTSLGGMCPTQAEGTWVDGQEFYFRARHNHYTLKVDPKDAVGGTLIAEGNDPSGGFMSDDEVLAILDAAAATGPAS